MLREGSDLLGVCGLHGSKLAGLGFKTAFHVRNVLVHVQERVAEQGLNIQPGIATGGQRGHVEERVQRLGCMMLVVIEGRRGGGGDRIIGRIHVVRVVECVGQEEKDATTGRRVERKEKV